MCGRYSMEADLDEVRRRFGIIGAADLCYAPDPKDVRPTDPIVTVIEEGQGHQGVMMRWGLPPNGRGKPLINARVETLESNNLWRKRFPVQRCLVVADGFYEWRQNPNGSKTQMWLGLRSGGLFSMAGVWGLVTDKVGQWVQSAAIITCPSNDLAVPIHDRMPVMLDRESEALWLDPLSQDPTVLKQVLVPFPSEAMVAHDYTD